MLTFFKPSSVQSAAFLLSEKDLPFSYPEVGRTAAAEFVSGYDNDINQIVLGEGNAVWESAKEAVRAWKMFPGGWACIAPERTPLREGEVVAMSARILGLWWLNSCRIVYVIDEAQRFGFAYGTLPGHAECGEELFLVEKDKNDVVYYSIRAFSRPRHWMARLAYPLARLYQRAFVRDSKRSMFAAVNGFELTLHLTERL